MQQETIKKSLLIIKSKPGGLGSAEGFLRNREWKVKATTNLKEALIYLVQEQPQFVMVSIDHPNKKVRNLPKILTQAFPVCVIAFAEDTSAASYNLLSASATEYLVYPPVTGPAIERTANKYYKDLQNKGLSASQARTGVQGDEEDGVIAIRGDSGFSAQNAQSVLAQMLGGDDSNVNLAHTNSTNPGGAAVGGNNKSQDPSYTNSQFDEDSNDPMMARGNSWAKDPGGGFAPGEKSQTGPHGYAPGENSTEGSAMGYAKGESSQGGDLTGFAKGSGNQTGGPVGHGHGAGRLHNNMFDEEGAEAKSYHQKGHNKGGPSWAPVDMPKKKDKERPTPEQIENDPLATKKDSIILKGTKEALDKSCVVTDFQQSEAVAESTNVSCIVVESNRFSGYLITAMGKDKKIDAAFIGKIRERLFKFLKENGEQIEDRESMDLEIREVPFEDWALQYAEFLRKSIHNGNEVAMAFFPRTDVKTQYGESATEEMASIKIDDLAGDVAVEFNVYIHLPRNNKYVLYTPRGGTFYNVQKERLQSQGVSQLHVLKGELKDLDKYRAQNFLNEKIQEFQEKEAPKTPATKQSA